MASAVCLAFGSLAGTAFAGNDDPDLELSIAEVTSAVPGGSGVVKYTITNVSDRVTDGVLINVSLPAHVSLDIDGHCQETGTNDEDGKLVSCNFSDSIGKLAPGESLESLATFRIADDAPASAELGTLDALVVPLEAGEATEDFTDLDGHNVVTTKISTTAAGDWWSSFMSFWS